MEVLRPEDAVAFLRLAGPLLERDEARNQLPLGIAGNLTARPDAFEVVRFWVVRDGDEPVAAAVRTEPFNLVLGDPSSEAALGPLLEAIVADDPEVPGIVGNVPSVETAAERLAGASGRTAEPILSQGVYGLTSVRDIARAPGEPRTAVPDDRGLLLAWLRAFADESLPDPEETFRHMEHNLENRFGSEGSASGSGRTAGSPCPSPASVARRQRGSGSARSTPRPSTAGAATRRPWWPT
jgi:hypothetical protein